jgi:hypothetical protein
MSAARAEGRDGGSRGDGVGVLAAEALHALEEARVLHLGPEPAHDTPQTVSAPPSVASERKGVAQHVAPGPRHLARLAPAGQGARGIGAGRRLGVVGAHGSGVGAAAEGGLRGAVHPGAQMDVVPENGMVRNGQQIWMASV